MSKCDLGAHEFMPEASQTKAPEIEIEVSSAYDAVLDYLFKPESRTWNFYSEGGTYMRDDPQ